MQSSREHGGKSMQGNQLRLRVQPMLFRKASQGSTLERIAAPLVAVPLTEVQRRHVVMGFILGVFSIITAFFPVCGLPFAIAGLFIGFSNRHITALRTVVFWGIGLSMIGLVFTIVNIVITTGLYFSTYFWGGGG
ncbi:MAG TPA: hypothetical protein VKY19_15890 [Ktedonosporobacter sp.]|jgi:hypothetical protein|nr:hypothetical protein [Ktedonosporobacter sp.]